MFHKIPSSEGSQISGLGKGLKEISTLLRALLHTSPPFPPSVREQVCITYMDLSSYNYRQNLNSITCKLQKPPFDKTIWFSLVQNFEHRTCSEEVI